MGICLDSLGGGEIGASCFDDVMCNFGYCNRETERCSRDCSFDGLCPTGSECVAVGDFTIEGVPFRRCE